MDDTVAGLWLLLLTRGRTEVTLGARRHVLEEGDVIMASTAEPFALTFAAGSEILLAYVEHRFVASVLGETLTGQRVLDPADPLTRILSQQLAALRPHVARIRSDLWPYVWRSVLHLLAGVIAAPPGLDPA
jgi:hypothetical protein